jgi:DNA-binding Lrp family transcriptional regulator
MTDALRSDTDLDETDLAILERVERDFDVSLETLAEELDLSKSAIHYRLNKLKDSGVIEGVTADVDPLAFGLEMVSITDVSVTHESGYSDDIGGELTALDGVEQVYYTMGDVDFVVISRVQTRDQLNDLIDRMVAIDGVNETSSRFVMQEFESAEAITANLSEEAYDAVLDSSRGD